MSVSEVVREQESVSDLVLYADAIEYFEAHDLSDELENGPEVRLEAGPNVRRRRYALDTELSQKLGDIARERGVSAEALLNEWVREKAAESRPIGAAE